MSRVDGFEYLIETLSRDLRVKTMVALEGCAEGFAARQLHDQISAFGREHSVVVDGNGVGVAQTGCRSRLALKAAQGVEVSEHAARQNLDGHLAVEPRVKGF